MQKKRILLKKDKGQSLILVALGLFTLLAFIGLAVDLGITYIERVRVRRAADAAALAAAAELPLETASHVRALEYLAENSYDCGLNANTSGTGASLKLNYNCTGANVRVEVNTTEDGVRQDPVSSKIFGPEREDADQIIQINTYNFRENGADTANRIQVQVTQRAHIYFMRLFGFDRLPVKGSATAENINNLDVVLVYDNSGSMEFDTLCYGCFVPTNYPNGTYYPLPWNSPNGQNTPPKHCAGGSNPLTYTVNSNTKKYIIIEAEEYSVTNNPYSRDMYTQGYTYWSIQRNGGQTPSYMGNGGGYGRDPIGAYIAHNPYRRHDGADGQGSNCTWEDLLDGRKCLRDSWILSLNGPFDTPRVDYDFRVPDGGTWYVWVRGQGGDGEDNLMWGINGGPIASVTGFSAGGSYNFDGANASRWKWIRMGNQTFNANQQYTLNLWAGAADMSVDRIIITTDNRDPSGLTSDSTFNGKILANETAAAFDNNRTGEACNPCDARFGGYPGGTAGSGGQPNCDDPNLPPTRRDRRLDYIYDDEQPMRGAVEAAKRFVARLDPDFDQIGLVYYNSNATVAHQLQCLRSAPATCSPTTITNTVIKSLDSLHAGGSTAIPIALQAGVETLSSQPGHYGRPGAAHIMILMTDGEANVYPSGSPCYAQDYWPSNTGDTSRDRAKDCTVYFARQARNSGVVLYTITLGYSADIELMQYIAELTGGFHRHAPRPDQLDPIFDELYSRIFLRLIE